MKLVWNVPALQEPNYSQIATLYAGILRKRDNMIISFNCSQCSRRYEKGWFSRYDISGEFSAIFAPVENRVKIGYTTII